MYADENGGRLVSANPSPNGWVNVGNTPLAIQGGLLWKYCANVGAYHCPSADRDQYRNYSIQWFMNGEQPQIVALSQLSRAEATFVFIEEHDNRGWNMGSFDLPPTGDQIIDIPGRFHRGSVLTFADGHVEFWLWQDAQMLTVNNFFATLAPPHPDLTRLQQAVKTW
jgi:prepilin-type processing-associated H-X9-DG protein